MIKVYSDEDFKQVYGQRTRVLNVFIGVSVAYLAICLACLFYFTSLPYAHPNLRIPKWIVYIASALFVGFAFPFMAIKFRRVNKYYKMLCYISQGIKNEEENYFVKFEKCDVQKDNVDAIVCVFMTWNRKKQEWMRREVYLDAEKSLPDFNRGDFVRYVTQSNFLIQHEILAKSVLDIDEVDEFGTPYDDVEEMDANSEDCDQDNNIEE